MRRLPVAVLAACATAVVLTAGAQSAPSPTEMRALKALAAARPAAAAVAAAPTSAGGPQHRTTPAAAAVAAAPVSSTTGASSATTGGGGEATTARATPTATAKPTATPAAPKRKPSKVKHVFVIALAGPGYQQTFGTDSPAKYLTQTLRPKGALLSGFTPLGAGDLPNYLAFAAGQPPNADTRKECATYADFPTGAAADKHGVVHGNGCVYPNTVLTLGDQVSASGGSWRSYAEGMATDDTKTCRHPEDGGSDDTTSATDGYATRHNPWVYFHSLLDLGDCLSSDQDLGALRTDLKSTRTTPNLAYIAPDLCSDGAASPCADGSAGGLPAADAFLAEWVPRILASAAYKKDGALIVTFLWPTAQAEAGTATGTLVVSRFAKPASLFAKPLDPYGLLHTTEDLLGLDPLARAAGAASFARLTLPGAFR